MFNITVSGMEDLNRQLNKLPEDLQKSGMRVVLHNANEKVLFPVVLANVPVDEGSLLEGLTIKDSVKRGRVSSAVVDNPVEGDEEFHGAFVELGTEKESQHSFLRKSLDENEDRIIAVIEEELQKFIDESLK